MSMINIEAKNVLQKILQRPKNTCNKNNYGKKWHDDSYVKSK